MTLAKALAAAAGNAGEATYVDDVFSTYLYTGKSTAQTIINGIDLAGEGGLVWFKNRVNGTVPHYLGSTGISPFLLSSNETSAKQGGSIYPANNSYQFNSDGFSIGPGGAFSNSGDAHVSWTFRKAEKFFDVVTYTGNMTARTIAHNLGSVPGCIIVKSTNGSGSWFVYHRSVGNTGALRLNLTNAVDTSPYWNNTDPTSTVFSLGVDSGVNANSTDYVAYLFAHNAGGFGADGTENVISCGSYTAVNGTSLDVNLGFEPQWLLVKKTNSTGDWWLQDNMRGFTAVSVLDGSVYLKANSSAAESIKSTTNDALILTSTGFTVPATSGDFNSNGSYIYIAIRRGPMKVPESGTSVYGAQTWTGGSTTFTTFPADLATRFERSTAYGGWKLWGSRLQGQAYLRSENTNAEVADNIFTWNNANNGTKVTFGATSSLVNYYMRRAPGFFDEVCYTGDSNLGRAIPHNLGVAPELMIVKNRNNTENWVAYSQALGATKYLILNSTAASGTRSIWANTSPTDTNFYVGGSGVLGETNYTTYTYVAYLFASCPGVSKVFSYTGNGSSQTINCGFTSGARFVLIKRTDSTGDWYVWDTARGMVAGNDPHLSLNTPAAEVTTDDSVDTDSTGFVVNQLSATNVNVSSATYIGLAIA